LRQTQGNINAAVEILARQAQPAQQQQPRDTSQHALTDDQKLVQLRNMGYTDMAANRDALRRTGGNVDVAVTVLKSNPLPAANNALVSMPQQQQQAPSLLDVSDPPSMQNHSLPSAFQFQQPQQQQYTMQSNQSFSTQQPFAAQQSFTPPPQQQQQQHPFAPQQQQFTPQQQQLPFATQPQLQYSALQPQQQYTMQPQQQSSPFSISSAADPFGQNTLAGNLYPLSLFFFDTYLYFTSSARSIHFITNHPVCITGFCYILVKSIRHLQPTLDPVILCALYKLLYTATPSTTTTTTTATTTSQCIPKLSTITIQSK
jgi:hypothetical protein